MVKVYASQILDFAVAVLKTERYIAQSGTMNWIQDNLFLLNFNQVISYQRFSAQASNPSRRDSRYPGSLVLGTSDFRFELALRLYAYLRPSVFKVIEVLGAVPLA